MRPTEIGIRALKQNAPAVVAGVVSGEAVTVTDRGRPVAVMIPLPSSPLGLLLASGQARPPRRDVEDLAELETGALRDWLWTAHPRLVSSDLARTELLRAVRRAAPDRVVQSRAVLDSLTLVQVNTSTFEAAGRLDPQILRTSNALHLAAAFALGDDLDSVVTYDDRLAEAARLHGVPVTAPG